MHYYICGKNVHSVNLIVAINIDNATKQMYRHICQLLKKLYNP